MNKKSAFLRISLVFLSAIILAPPLVFGYEAMTVSPQDRFSEEELDQMLAPIALYPDSLLAPMLMAATYPLEVVEAARWVSQHPDLKDELLDEALLEKDWDVSVKSLAHFPQILAMMDENIEWTSRLGDAFLVQKDDVMDTIQDLRAKAEAAGNLRSTQEQLVAGEPGAITIAPAYPGEMYVPVYDPLWVYGPWWYPAYLPFTIGYAGISIVSGVFDFAFGFTTAGLFGWCDWDWGHHDIYVDYGRAGRFHHFYHDGSYGRQRWEHNSGHRRGVAYWDRKTSRRFGQHPERSVQGRNEFRENGDQRFYHNPDASFQRPGIAHNNFESRQRGQNQQLGSQRNFERGEFGTSERVRRSPEKSMQSRNEFRGYGDQGFRRQPTESFQPQGVARDNFGSRQRRFDQQFGSQRSFTPREFGARERLQQRDRTSTFRGFGEGTRNSFTGNRQFSRRESPRGGLSQSSGGRGFLSSGGSHGGNSGGRGGGGSSHGNAGGFFGGGSGFNGGGGRGR
ncbi:MAG: DUF3300 domain-containing protein [Thermodesulfobacteriota bacterium]|jgi:hypothetical protein|nr:MAG: DUF3300 domain-containing protein [Thermodesulfobacteriota bacterium]